MQNLYDYKKFAILYVDDEEKSLKYFARAFEDHFRILTAANAQDGLKLLEEHKDEIGLLMTADRIVSLGLLAAGLSHHIRNSLVAVKTFLDLAPAKLEEEKISMDSLRNPDFWKEYYQNVQGQIGKINNMLKDLWTASEKPAFTFADRVQLHTVVAETLEQLKPGFAAKNIQVENAIPDSLPHLNVDKPKFYRLFELLLQDEI